MIAWLCEYGIWTGAIGGMIWLIIGVLAIMNKNDTLVKICLIGMLLYLLLGISSSIMQSIDENVSTDDYRENATVVEIYSTTHFRCATQYHVILKGSQKEEHEFFVNKDSFDKIENGAKVLLITKTYTTKYTKETRTEYDWEFGEIK